MSRRNRLMSVGAIGLLAAVAPVAAATAATPAPGGPGNPSVGVTTPIGSIGAGVGPIGAIGAGIGVDPGNLGCMPFEYSLGPFGPLGPWGPYGPLHDKQHPACFGGGPDFGK
jgi:hypothetical protein